MTAPLRTIDGYDLSALRRQRGVTQVTLAEALNSAQNSVSRLERQQDMHISTLRRYVEALGGELRITALFDDDGAEVTIDLP